MCNTLPPIASPNDLILHVFKVKCANWSILKWNNITLKKGLFCAMFLAVKNSNFKWPWHVIYQFEGFDEFYMGKFKKNVTVQLFYPHALNMEYFYLILSLKGVFQCPLTCCQVWKNSNNKWKRYVIKTTQKCQECNAFCVTFFQHVNVQSNILANIVILHQFKLLQFINWHVVDKIPKAGPFK